jgi:hypothetical protein
VIRQLSKVLARLENKQQLGTSMIPWGLFGSGIKAGLEIYKNKKAADVAMSEAKLLHIEKMKRGEIEFSGKIADNQKNDWKDEFVLLTISSPLFLLAYSVFAEDEKMQEKIDLYFQKLQEMPWWIVGLWVTVVTAIYGLKATDVINMNKKASRNGICKTRNTQDIQIQERFDKDPIARKLTEIICKR